MEVSRLGDPKLRQIAAYNAIVAAQELLKKSEEGEGPGARKSKQEMDIQPLKAPAGSLDRDSKPPFGAAPPSNDGPASKAGKARSGGSAPGAPGVKGRKVEN